MSGPLQFESWEDAMNPPEWVLWWRWGKENEYWERSWPPGQKKRVDEARVIAAVWVIGGDL
jgi:hypothetical protein